MPVRRGTIELQHAPRLRDVMEPGSADPASAEQARPSSRLDRAGGYRRLGVV